MKLIMMKKQNIYKNKKKILILGFGKIGTAFYELFLKKKCNLYVVDKKKRLN
jgi:UDP-N-acetylmuramoylalanine-D-glutamate ligase